MAVAKQCGVLREAQIAQHRGKEQRVGGRKGLEMWLDRTGGWVLRGTWLFTCGHWGFLKEF